MNKLMTHLVAGYPDLSTTKALLQYMISKQVDSIELQIPFSDPLADGPKLMAANDVAVNSGVSVAETLELIASSEVEGTKLFIMSYLQPIISYGAEKFFHDANHVGCKGYILPDLPYDAPEMNQYIDYDASFANKYIPVLSPGMSSGRLKEIFTKLAPETVYITARSGITGEHTDNYSDELNRLIDEVRRLSDARIAVGFGVQNETDVKNVLKFADLAVVGSSVVSELGISLDNAKQLVDKLAEAAK